MAINPTYLAAATVKMGASSGSAVDLSDMAQNVTVTENYPGLESTSLSNTNRQYVKGLGDHEATFSLLVSYASGNSYATIQPLVGTNCYAEFTPTDAAVSATNPKVSISDCLLESFTPVVSSLGELGVYEITLRGGDIDYATS